MSNRIELTDEYMESVVGGKITFDWDGANGHCGLNGDKSYSFNDKTAFFNLVYQCFTSGKTDVQAIEALLAAGIIWKN